MVEEANYDTVLVQYKGSNQFVPARLSTLVEGTVVQNVILTSEAASYLNRMRFSQPEKFDAFMVQFLSRFVSNRIGFPGNDLSQNNVSPPDTNEENSNE